MRIPANVPLMLLLARNELWYHTSKVATSTDHRRWAEVPDELCPWALGVIVKHTLDGLARIRVTGGVWLHIVSEK